MIAGVVALASLTTGQIAFCATAQPSPLEWKQSAQYRSASLPVPSSGKIGFTLMSPERTGVRFTNQLAEALLAANQILEIGSGVALGDVDGDGWIDIYLCARNGANRLYRNLGDWRFEDITEKAGVACAGQQSTGAVLADVDGDGDLDLLVNAVGGGTRLFLNQGEGVFREAIGVGLQTGQGSTSMALGDFDGDGLLDLYVANYHTNTVKDSGAELDLRAGYVDGKFVVNRPDLFAPVFTKAGGVSLVERGEPDVFYRNEGQGKFRALSWTDGTFLDEKGEPLKEPPRDWALSVAFRDLNGDGQPDLYVCNDFFNSPDRIWLNDGHGHFRALSVTAWRQSSLSSMAVDFADINRDGIDDFFVLDMMSRSHERRHRQRGSLIHVQAAVPIRDPLFRPETPRNTLFLGRGDGTFAEIAQYAGVDASEWSWAVAFLDVDLDGFEDLLITTGNLRDANDADLTKERARRMEPGTTLSTRRRPLPRLETAKQAFRNLGDCRFEECGRAWGFDSVGIAHGLAMADLDNDGDLDVVVNEMNRAVGLYRNDCTASRLAVRLKGRPPNIQGIGARIVVQAEGLPVQSQEIMSGGRYLSGDDPERVFAAGNSSNRTRIAVHWRSGSRTVLDHAAPNSAYEVAEPEFGAPQPPAEPSRPPPRDLFGKPLFENVSSKLTRAHREEDFDDFVRQPLLPRRLSQLGPGITWYDLDGDGWEDLLIGAGAKEHQVLYLNDGKEEFRPMRRQQAPTREETTLLASRSAGGVVSIFIGFANYEDGRTDGAALTQFFPQTDTEKLIAAAGPSSIGPLALGVVGEQLALFAGGRVRAGRYPEAASSQLFLSRADGWAVDTNSNSVLAGIGLVSGATWTDWDGDGVLELVVAEEWGPIRVYALREGKWQEITRQLGLDAFVGWWNGVSIGDFDGDGRLDILASNWGRNTKYQRHRDRPLRLYFGDWTGLGRVDMLEAYYEPGLGKYVPFLPLDQLRQACPSLAERFSTFAAYASAGIDEILGERGRPPIYLEANWLESTLFLNRGTRVEAKVLPMEAQLAPAFGLAVGDCDGDGNEDVFLAQNFFGVDAETSRSDAGRGLWLRGDGQGGLRPMTGQESGVVLDGEQRGCALCDYNHDGRVDLAVGQNRGRVGLFRNRGGKPGLRVRLRGPAWNPDGIGAAIRLRYGDRRGPVRLITAGAGYWSQDALVQVLGHAEMPTGIEVRWPGGKITTRSLLATDQEVLMSSP